MADEDLPEETTDNPELDDLLWVKKQLRITIPELSPKERISALEAYRKLIGSIAQLKKATNAGGGGAAADAIAGIVQDAPSGGTEGPWEDHPDVTRYDAGD